MKLIAVIVAFYVLPGYVIAQDKGVEAEIRRLEQMEVQAVLDKDSTMLLKLWDANFTVNAPDNKINFAGKTTLDRAVLRGKRSAFTREIEHVIIKGDFAFSMGSETVGQPDVNTTIKRRFTNIW